MWGGGFSVYKGVANSANRIAKLDLSTGSLDMTFSPAASNGFNSSVETFLVSGSSLYVGGNFTKYRDTESSYYFVPLDLNSGDLLD